MTRWTLVLALALAATPARGAGRVKVAVLDVKAVQGVSAGTATILTSIIAADTQRAGFDVVSQADIAALVGFERQRKMLGCGDDSSCLAEIGGALGADYVLSTQVGQLGSRFHLALMLLDARKARVLSRVSTFSGRSEDALAEAAEKALQEALAPGRERAAAEKAGAARPVAAPATTAILPRTPPSPPTPTPTPTSTSSGDATAARRGTYVELRGGSGWGTPPIATAGGSLLLGGALRVGLDVSSAWSVELGAAHRALRRTSGNVRWYEAGVGVWAELPAEDDVRTTEVLAAAVWTPRALRWLSVAGDAGVAFVSARHRVGKYDPGPPAPKEPVTETWSGAAPRAGAELRVDLPVRRVVLGLRAGVDLVRTPKREMLRNPYTAFPETEPKVTWLRQGWLVSFPVELSARYVF